MLTVGQIAEIRRMYHVDAKGFKTIARELRISKNTIKKIIKQDILKQSYCRTRQSYAALGNHTAMLEEKLSHDKTEPKRRKRTAKKLYDEICILGYTGTYESVNNFVRKWRRDDSQTASKTVYVPLEFDKGEAFQFDWSTEEIELAGKLTRIKVAHIRLSYSRFFFAMAFPNEQLEMVMESHNKAFEFFGGVCRKGIYDNMKTAVQKVLVGKDRIFNKRFAELASHYLFELIACTPAAGWEKGQVENQVQTSRQNFFTPLCRVSSLEELNQALRQQCLDWAKTRKHPEVKDKTVWEMYQQEKPYLKSYKTQFEPFKVISSSVSSYSLIAFDSNNYSVDCNYIREPIEIRVYPAKIEVWCKDKIIANHDRCFLKNKKIYDPWHYIPALERKPGALRNGAPFKQLHLPAAVTAMQQALLKYSNGEKAFIKLLLKAHEVGLVALEKACAEALNCGISNHEWIMDKMIKSSRTDNLSSQSQKNNDEVVDADEVVVTKWPTNSCCLNIKEAPSSDCHSYNRVLLNITINSTGLALTEGAAHVV